MPTYRDWYAFPSQPMPRADEKQPTRKKVYFFVDEFISRRGRAPSVQEICDGIGIDSKSHVWYHLRTLEKHGYLKVLNNRAYGIRLTNKRMEVG